MTSSDLLTLKPIGVINSPFKQKFTTPRQSGLVAAAQAEIVFNRKYVQEGALDGLSDFSHVWLIFYFHKNIQAHSIGKVKPPRLEGKKMGVFATRSPHRPNPMGLSLVKLDRVDLANNSIWVSGADLIQGTPILDIKPYLADFDFAPNVAQGWTEHVEKVVYPLEWTASALAKIQELKVPPHYVELIAQTLSLETRNLEDKKRPDKIYNSLLEHYDVSFQFHEQGVLVTDIRAVESTQQ